MQPKINIDLNREYTLKVTGSDIIHLINGLGELPHKIAGPLERKIVDQLVEPKPE